MTGASLRMTVEKAQNIPPVVDGPTAAAILGIGRTAAYEGARARNLRVPALARGATAHLIVADAGHALPFGMRTR